MLKKYLTVLVTAGLAFSLAGCINPPGYQASKPQAPTTNISQVKITDNALETNINGTLHSTVPHNNNIYALVWHHKTLLLGRAKTRELKEKALNMVLNVYGVGEVKDEIVVDPNYSPSLVYGANDTRITSQVKASLLLTKTIDSLRIKVVTQDSVVYLLCNTDEQQARVAASVARQVQGVAEVKYLLP